ncbi:MAG: V-type ATPase subunit [Candidatus Omnitrophota bacterium]
MQMDFSGDTRYAYAVGKIRVLETRLLDGEDIERMVEAQNFDACLRILAQSADYQEDLAKFKNPAEFEQILFSQLLRTYSATKALFVDTEIINALLLRYDFMNIKALVRARYSNVSPRLIELGTISLKLLSDGITKGDLRDLPLWLKELVKGAIGLFEKDKDPLMLDKFLDEALLRHIDTDVSRFPAIKNFFKMYTQGKSEDELLGYIKAAKYLTFGAEPVFGYIIAKENEIALLRSIFIGKLYNESQESIRERLGHTYA